MDTTRGSLRPTRRDGRLVYDRRNLDEQRALLTTHSPGAGWQCDALLAAAATADDFYFDAFAQVHMPTISQGRVTLAGDAGYCASPLSGMGTSLALVGAYVLPVNSEPLNRLTLNLFRPRCIATRP